MLARLRTRILRRLIKRQLRVSKNIPREYAQLLWCRVVEAFKTTLFLEKTVHFSGNAPRFTGIRWCLQQEINIIERMGVINLVGRAGIDLHEEI